MTQAQITAMHKALHKQHMEHLNEAGKYSASEFPAIWTARMAAAHTCLSLAHALTAALTVTPSDPYDGK